VFNKTHSTARRFSDLDWLNSYLTSKYEGFSIPPLPGKDRFSRNSEGFLERRRREIEKYLNIIVNHHRLQEDEVL
jgi:hypothetical protein